MESGETIDALINGNSEFRNNIVHAYAATIKVGDASKEGAVNSVIDANGNTKLTASADVKLTDPFKMTAVNLMPASGSPAASGADFTGLDANFFQTVNFIGAVGTTDWAQGWANWDPNNADY